MSTAKFEHGKRDYISMSVYRDANGSDSTNGGHSSKRTDLYVWVGKEGTPAEFFEDAHGEIHPVFELNERMGSYNIRPVKKDSGMCGPMFGGNYASGKYTPEFRDLPDMIMIHDRFETWEMYDMLSR